MKSWVFKFIRWLLAAKIILSCIFFIALALSLSFYMWPSESSIRLSGYGLQLIGMTLTIQGLLRVRKHFNLPSLWTLFLKWLKDFPRGKQNVNLNAGSIQMTTSISNARLEQWCSDETGQSIENRLGKIIKNIEYLKQEQRNYFTQVNNKYDELKNDLKKLDCKSDNLKKEVNSNFKNFHINDWLISFVGITYLTIGITLSTLAPEFYAWLK